MVTAFIYAFGIDISRQFKEIEEYANSQKIKLLNKYFDSKDLQGRQKFNKMIRDALAFPPNYIITIKSEYISKDIETLKLFEDNMLEFGIKMIYLKDNLDFENNKKEKIGDNLENRVETKVPAILLKEKELSMEKEEVKVSLENENNYRTTHHSPYGYRAKKIGQRKYIWEKEEIESDLVRKILISLYTDKGFSYQEIRDWLNENEIETRRKQAWSTSSVVNLFKKDRLQIYSGIENDIAIINTDEYDKVMERKAYNASISTFGKTKHSSYVLTGPNIRLEPIFVCKSCASNVIGYKNSSKTWSNYVCSNYRNKGHEDCSNNWYLKQDKVEDTLWQVINRAYLDKEKLKQYKLEIVKLYKTNTISFTRGMKIILKNLLEKKIEVKDIVEAARDAESVEQREIVRLFVEKVEMDNKDQVVYMKLYGARKVKVQF